MNRATFDALLAAAGGRDLAWGALEREREAWDRAAASWDRERGALSIAAAGWDRERDLLLDRETASVAAVQKQLDFVHGLVTVRAALEGIVTSRFPGTNVTDALSRYCSSTEYVEYLAAVSVATGFSASSLAKAAKEAYGSLSATIHGGSTHVSNGGAVPAAVLGDERTLYGIAAIFKLSRRDIRFYAGGAGATIKLPSPVHSPPGSASQSPPKARGGAAAGALGGAQSLEEAPVAAVSAGGAEGPPAAPAAGSGSE